MTTRYIELLDVDLPIRQWEDHELEAAVREWWKKVNSTPWNPVIAAANFRLRLPQVRTRPEHLIRYPRAMADDVRLLRAIAQRNQSEPAFADAVIRQIVETQQFDPPSLLRIPTQAPEVAAELEVLRRALALPASTALQHVGVCDFELPRPPGATLTISTLNGEYVDDDGDSVDYEQWLFEVYEPVRVRLSIERHGGGELTRTILHGKGVNVAPLLDALKEQGLAAKAEETAELWPPLEDRWERCMGFLEWRQAKWEVPLPDGRVLKFDPDQRTRDVFAERRYEPGFVEAVAKLSVEPGFTLQRALELPARYPAIEAIVGVIRTSLGVSAPLVHLGPIGKALPRREHAFTVCSRADEGLRVDADTGDFFEDKAWHLEVRHPRLNVEIACRRDAPVAKEWPWTWTVAVHHESNTEVEPLLDGLRAVGLSPTAVTTTLA